MDAYRYGGESMGGLENLAGADRGLLDRPNRNYSQRREIGNAYTELDSYNALDDYNKSANRVLYSYDYNGTPRDKHSKIGDTYNKDLVRGLYTDDAYASVLTGLQDTEKEHGVLKVKKLDKGSVQRELDLARSNDKYKPSDRGNPYMDMYSSMGTYEYKKVADDGGGIDMYDAPTNYSNEWVATGDTHTRYIKELEDILADDNDRYASFWSHSKKEYRQGYQDLSNSLKQSSADFKNNYIKGNEQNIQNQRDQLADMETVNAERVTARNEVYARLFNNNTSTKKKRYL